MLEIQCYFGTQGYTLAVPLGIVFLQKVFHSPFAAQPFVLNLNVIKRTTYIRTTCNFLPSFLVCFAIVLTIFLYIQFLYVQSLLYIQLNMLSSKGDFKALSIIDQISLHSFSEESQVFGVVKCCCSQCIPREYPDSVWLRCSMLSLRTSDFYGSHRAAAVCDPPQSGKFSDSFRVLESAWILRIVVWGEIKTSASLVSCLQQQ